MAKLLHADGLGNEGLSIVSFAERHGLSVAYIQKLCRTGKIFGARLHVKTRQWWIYPPAKLLCSPRNKQGNTSNLMTSTLRDVKQV